MTLRRLLTLPALLGSLCAGGAFVTVLFGAFGGPSWLLVIGLTLSALVLALLGDVAEKSPDGAVALGLRSGGPRAHAPALVRGVRAVDRETGRVAGDARAQESVFAFDLVVVPEDRPAYRVEVRHPLDLQDLLHQDRAVVEYDPKQPWRVVVPDNPPGEWRARARRLDPDTVSVPDAPRRGLPPGSQVLVLGVLIAAAVFALVRGIG
ncbi:hypothetical protein ABII15_32630 [Streptomyces sp. HUAS MG91]|uniref:DUF3592 domain-containing protein n=1 Tax=Streptomyces tabacisoli TaxID=3156398 RepID=A0AAU8J2I9_9ACTN